jgi:hypothetical protein
VLRPGDVVEVRAAAEILATLDSDASTDKMPFMPEMLRFSGKRFTVSRRVEKICDTVSGGPVGSRRMRDTVLLEDLRCDGSGHGGCQAGCRLYWRESWLRRVDSGSEPESRQDRRLAQLEKLARDGTRALRDVDEAPPDSYRCQATHALLATEPLSSFDLRQYIRELSSRNVGPVHFLRVAVRGLSGEVSRRLRVAGIRRRLRRLVSGRPPHHGVCVPPRGELNLQPGDMVRVRPPKEIARTLDESGKTRGLWFDNEMITFCGGEYRVQDRVERIIDERTGQMIEISSDCLILGGVACSGEHSHGRWFCPRGIYPYWREAWLRRVEDSDPSSSAGSAADAASFEER